MSQDTGILGGVEIFANLTPDETAIFASHMKELRFRKGELLFREGDAGTAMYIVIEGKAGVNVRLPDGGELEVAEIGCGSFLGEMSIFEPVPRSATCVLKEDSLLMSLDGEAFFSLMDRNPRIALRVMRSMLTIVCQRLKNTGAFLSDMVQWGENARRRAITDEDTGLYNRRFLDEVIGNRFREAVKERKSFTLVMVDLDRFGVLNREYGQATCDRILRDVAGVFSTVFKPEHILARYGGDEFTFILSDTTPQIAREICERAGQELRQLEHPENGSAGNLITTASIGIASWPHHAADLKTLKERADQALYRAKEQGRDRVVVFEETGSLKMSKNAIATIAEKNRIIGKIIETMIEGERFLLVGHRNPDDDCLASMVAFSILLSKFNRKVYMVVPGRLHPHFSYLLNICKHNMIEFVDGKTPLPTGITAVALFDTPKPEMLEKFNGSPVLMNDPGVVKIEFDHHLHSDSAYIGDRGYCLVDDATSSSELVGILGLKLNARKDLLERFGVDELLSRNFILAVLTGIIGDSKMGKYLKTPRERWYYSIFTRMFNELLSAKTYKDSRNFSSMEDIHRELESISAAEEACAHEMMQYRMKLSGVVGTVALDRKAMTGLLSRYPRETIISAARGIADTLAEESGRISIVAYCEDPGETGLIQFRMRRAHAYQDLDLRIFLEYFGIDNGGGHPGAIGFRLENQHVPDLKKFLAELVEGAEKLMGVLPLD